MASYSILKKNEKKIKILIFQNLSMYTTLAYIFLSTITRIVIKKKKENNTLF